MKSKAPLPLMEQLIMVLVFALTAALCLQGFSLADRFSNHQEAQAKAVVMAQNAAEMLKYTHGDFVAASEHLGGFVDDSAWYIAYDEAGQVLTSGAKADTGGVGAAGTAESIDAAGTVVTAGIDDSDIAAGATGAARVVVTTGVDISDIAVGAYLLTAAPLETGDSLLGSAHIQVLYKNDVLFEITVAWQEVNADEIP